MPDPEPSERPWVAPPSPSNGDGVARRVGVEIEFNGLSVTQAAETVQALFGGETAQDLPNTCDVTGTALGDFRCELDVRFAHEPSDSALMRTLRDAGASVGAAVLPIEIVCPPVPWSQGPALDRLCAALAAQGAEGTRDSLLYAYGVQLNPELPTLEPAFVLQTLRAFLMLRDRLRGEIAVDPSRRLWRFEAPFPKAYRQRILDPDYGPSLRGFIDDYVAANPTRNRELDLLPLLTFLDADRVRAALPDETIKPRPTWHYRLPNADLGDESWSIGREWARWVMVERLAAAPRLMDRIGSDLMAGEGPGGDHVPARAFETEAGQRIVAALAGDPDERR
jgi:hypothetical protein